MSHHKEVNRLVLGTAQFGMSYGIANQNGKPNHATATEIIRKAWESGIREFDTGQGYGDSETVLGKAFLALKLSEKALVISKFSPQLDHLNANIMSEALEQSLEKLGVPVLYGIMLHREELISYWDQGLKQILRNFVKSGKVKKVGISVYSPEKAILALNTDGIDFVQFPSNILDRRFEQAKVFELADQLNKRIYIRSVFLQGLILMLPEEIPETLDFTRPVIAKINSLADELKLKRQELALGYLKMEMPHSQIIFGAEQAEQVDLNVECWMKNYSDSLTSTVKCSFTNISEKIINPTLW